MEESASYLGIRTSTDVVRDVLDCHEQRCILREKATLLLFLQTPNLENSFRSLNMVRAHIPDMTYQFHVN